MKIRSGHVSNSSSASFIIKWKFIDDYEFLANDLIHFVADGLNIFTYSKYKKLFIRNSFYTKIDDDWTDWEFFTKKEFMKAVEHTIVNKTIATSTFYTSMYNDAGSLPPIAHKMLSALTVNDDVEIISTDLVRD